MNKKKFIILILSFTAIAAVVVVLAGFYPIALVNWRPITMKSFQTDYSAGFNYYQKALQTYNKDQAPVLESEEIRRELKRAVLDKLVENVLIGSELKKYFKNGELGKMVDEKIEEAVKGSDVKKEVEELYSLSFEEFKERFLKPQAKQEVLEARLLLENKNFDDCLKEIKNRTKVMIFLPGLKWSGEGVVVK